MESAHRSPGYSWLGTAWLLPRALSRWTLRPALDTLVQHCVCPVWNALGLASTSCLSPNQLASCPFYPVLTWSNRSLSGLSSLPLSLRLWTSAASTDPLAALWPGCSTVYHSFFDGEQHTGTYPGYPLRTLCSADPAPLVALYSALTRHCHSTLSALGD